MLYNYDPQPRPLKRPRLGVPDVYPQEPKQREDELNPSNVKNGFQALQQISEEFGTARNSNITMQRLNIFYTSVNSKRNELNTLPDNGRKKQPINIKDNLWHVTGRNKNMLDMWFRDLAGNKPLVNLAKKPPSFNKKEEIFTYLCDHQVSMRKAMWFIKLSAAHQTAATETSKIKKRQVPDPSIEWTGIVKKVMSDLAEKLNEHYVLLKKPREPKKTAIACTAHKCIAGKCIPGRCPLGRCIPGKCYPHKCIPGKCVPGKCLPVKCIPIFCSPNKGPHSKCTKEKCIFKDRKVIERIVREKSLREKVLKQSLLKDPRFKETKSGDTKSGDSVRRKRPLPVTSTLCPTQHPYDLKNRPVLRARRRGHRSAMKLFRLLGDRTKDTVKQEMTDEAKDSTTMSTTTPMSTNEKPKDEIDETTNCATKSNDSKSGKDTNEAKKRGYAKITEIITEMAKLASRRRKRALARRKKTTSNRTPSRIIDDIEPKSNQSETSPMAQATTPTQSPSPRLGSNESIPQSPGGSQLTPTSQSSPNHTQSQHSHGTSGSMYSGYSPSGNRDSPGSSSHTFLAPAPPPPTQVEDFGTLFRQWHYCSKLCRAMCEDNLLDRYEFLQAALELVDRMRCKSSDDGFLKVFIPFVFQFMPFIVESERLSRRLAYLVCKKLGYMLHYVTEDDIINAPSKKTTATIATTCCETNIASRIEGGLKLKPEPEIRQPLATRSSSSRFKKVKIDSTSPSSSPSSQSPISSKQLLPPPPPPPRPISPQNAAVSTSPVSSSVSATIASVVPLSAKPHPRTRPPSKYMDTLLKDFMLCSHHRPLILQLSAMLQIITLQCPSALVWCGLMGQDRDNITPLAGGPLEYLPVLPSQLPMPSNNRQHNDLNRKRLRHAEQQIIERSKHSEKRWICDKWQRKTLDSTINDVILNTLAILDSHCFDRLDANNNNLDSLYMKIFQPVSKVVKQETYDNGNVKETRITYNARTDEPIVKVLCEWAVSHQRFGEHRAMIVAWLLEKRQSDVTATDPSGPSNDHDSNDSVGFYNGLPIFQRNLMSFLDYDAPVIEEACSEQNRIKFTNLVHLFCELIRHDVFSHDAYMCTLISRGEVLSMPSKPHAITPPATVPSIPPPSTSLTSTAPAPSIQRDVEMLHSLDFKPKMEEFDDNVDDDLDKILQNIKEDQQNMMDAPDSPKIEPSGKQETKLNETDDAEDEPKLSRHYIYTKHFPLNHEDPSSQHDCNQRYILLFGVGKERDEKKHTVKKMAKEISKLYSKKFSMDMAEGGKVKKNSRVDYNFDTTTTRFQAMTYFDQHAVTWQCSSNVLEMISNFASGSSNYLPVQEHVAYLFDLMETAVNIYGLIELCMSIVKELPLVESQLIQKRSPYVKSYTSSMGLYIVGVLRRYLRCLLLSYDQVLPVFEGLCRVVRHVTNPSVCTSAERCILIFLYDLCASCSLLKTKPPSTESFFNVYGKVKQLQSSAMHPNPASHTYDRKFMVDFLMNPRRGGQIDPARAKLLNDPANRYSFVCNALIAVSRETDNDRLNDLSIMCAEFNAHCNALSAEWLGAFIALCGSSNENFYPDLPEHIDIQKVCIHNSLAVFVSILVARHSFSLEKFAFYVALPALVNACKAGREITPIAEAGARLSVHLLYRMFKAIELPVPALYGMPVISCPIKIPGPQCNIKLSCDRHLLSAAHKNIAVGPVLAVLKGILVVADAMDPENQKPPPSANKRGGRHTTPASIQPPPPPKPGPIDISHILGTSDLVGMVDEEMIDQSQETPPSLSEFAHYVLKQISYQEWVLERILQNADDLLQTGMLIDPMLTSKQAQRLLQMICFDENDADELNKMDQNMIIQRYFQNLDRWNMPIACINLQLMHKQSSNTVAETNKWLDAVARGAVEIYYTPKQKKPKPAKKSKNSKNNQQPLQRDIPKVPEHGPGIWLVIPLLEKLPSTVRARIVKIAGQVMEKSNFYNIYRWTEEDEDSEEESENDSDDDSEDNSDDESDE